MNICKRAVAGELFPGDEGDNYQENPGEGYAEAYRVLNLTKQGATSIGWDIVDPALYPNATALSMLEQDITTAVEGPDSVPRARLVRQRQRPDDRHQDHARRLVRRPPARPDEVAHAASRSTPAGASSRAAAACATRSAASAALTLKVQRVSGRGAFTVDVSKP